SLSPLVCWDHLIAHAHRAEFRIAGRAALLSSEEQPPDFDTRPEPVSARACGHVRSSSSAASREASGAIPPACKGRQSPKQPQQRRSHEINLSTLLLRTHGTQAPTLSSSATAIRTNVIAIAFIVVSPLGGPAVSPAGAGWRHCRVPSRRTVWPGWRDRTPAVTTISPTSSPLDTPARNESLFTS